MNSKGNHSMELVRVLSPEIVTLLTTFKCTAKCRNCCFQCSPKVEKKMTLDEMKSWLEKCFLAFPSIKMVVFSGGECTLLGDSLVEILAYISQKGKLTRIVTNGWWALNANVAEEYVRKLKQAGLNEINFSSGDEHQEWIPFERVRNAAVASINNGLACAINLETHDDTKFDFKKYLQCDNEFASLCTGIVSSKRKIVIEHGIWASMHETDEHNTYNKFEKDLNYKRCLNLFNNVPINPYGEVLACCGITSEKNPFLRLGNIKKEEIHSIYERSFTDILKIWLYVSGPINILKYIYEKKGITENIPVGHMCQLCQKIFCNKEYLTVLREHFGDFVPSVLLKYNLLTKKKN